MFNNDHWPLQIGGLFDHIFPDKQVKRLDPTGEYPFLHLIAKVVFILKPWRGGISTKLFKYKSGAGHCQPVELWICYNW